MEWKRVLGTHEEEQPLSSGPWLGKNFPGVALPCIDALRKWVILRFKDKICCAQVMDVGPWAIDDREYVFGDAMPRAEFFKGHPCPTKKGGKSEATVMGKDGSSKPAPISNGAGIDLFPYTATQLGIKIGDNVEVEWRWVI